MADITTCFCGVAPGTEPPVPKFAVWLHGRGWLVDTCGGDATIGERLRDATWYSTEDEARAVLDSIMSGGVDPRDLGTVVTL